MDIDLGTSGSESTFTNTIVEISRQPITSSHFNLDGSVTVQKAPTMKREFTVILVRPTHTATTGEVALLEAEHDKDITLKFTHDDNTYDVRFNGSLDKSTDRYNITFTLQEV